MNPFEVEIETICAACPSLTDDELAATCAALGQAYSLAGKIVTARAELATVYELARHLERQLRDLGDWTIEAAGHPQERAP